MDMEPNKEGGMQLGFSTKSRRNGTAEKHCVGVLLNLKTNSVENPLGRGWLVRNYLETEESFPEYVENLNLQRYSGFSLVGIEIRYERKNAQYRKLQKVFQCRRNNYFPAK